MIRYKREANYKNSKLIRIIQGVKPYLSQIFDFYRVRRSVNSSPYFS